VETRAVLENYRLVRFETIGTEIETTEGTTKMSLKLAIAFLIAALFGAPVGYAVYHEVQHESGPSIWRDSGPHGGTVHGAPGPIAGAGLPILAVGYGAYWLVRRYRRKSNQTAS
jgi:hypothetical protein